MSNDTEQSEGIVQEQSRQTIEELINDNNAKIYKLRGKNGKKSSN